jgi:hypothetical protein
LRFRLLPFLVALATAACALFLAAHYPLYPALAVALVLACSVTAFLRPHGWLLLPALLPVVGFAPWTGWITFEELDMALLALAAGSYGRLAWPQASPGTRALAGGSAGAMWLLAGLFGLSVVIGTMRGVADAGGWSLGWYQGYQEPLNSLRLAKSFFLALLMAPLWRLAFQEDPERAQTRLWQGLVAGLALTSLATIWERVAFTGLADFSSAYRTTGPFWEMHLGGATLDGFLALAVPFAAHALVQARKTTSAILAAAVLALAAYACMTTFSRSVYLAVPIGLIVFALLQMLRTAPPTVVVAADNTRVPALSLLAKARLNTGLVSTTLLVASFGVGAAWMFQSSGYRGMAALLGTAALMLPLAAVARQLKPPQWLAGVVAAASLLTLAAAATWLLPKGAYVAWALLGALTAGTIVRAQHGAAKAPGAAVFALGGFLAMAGATVMVAGHWGETAGLIGALPVLLALLATGLASTQSSKPLWPNTLQWHISTVTLMAVAAGTVGVFSGGAYMTGRFSTNERDLDTRFAHWALAYDMMRTPADFMLGKGLGRFPANYFLVGKLDRHPGDYRLKTGEDPYLTITGGRDGSGWGEIFRVTQRVEPPGLRAVVNTRVRTTHDIALHFEICEKHLLYGQSCVGGDAGVKAAPGVWQPLQVEMRGTGPPERGSWFAPRLIAFSVAMDSRGVLADLDDLTLHTADGRALLRNGSFSDGMAHWFFSSDRNHLPWHIKNLPLNTFFEQGAVGAILLALMLGLGLWRTSFGEARGHALAPALAAGLVGFFVVGMFDSLVDATRLAWLFYLLLLIALLLPRQLPASALWLPPRQALGGFLLMVLLGAGMLHPGTVMATETVPPGQVLQVGPERAVRTMAEASRLAKDGMTIEVDAGEYVGDVAVWTQNRLTLRAVGGRVRLKANGASAEGKGLWVMRGDQMSVDGFDFTGTQVPDRNGAGIRLERGRLQVRNCRFIDNENGIMTSNNPQVELDIVDSEFAHNGFGDGLTHNLYAGAIARLSVRGSHFHHALVGHLLKSRAAINDIRYNRLADGPGGRASYELEFPNGGLAYVVGNIIEQGERTGNPHLVSYAAEGYRWPVNALYLVHNTFIDKRPGGGVVLRVKPGNVAVTAVNNLLVASSRLETSAPGDYRNNIHVQAEFFDSGAPADYRPRARSRSAGTLAPIASSAEGIPLQPSAQYRPPLGTVDLQEKPHNPGAVQTLRSAARP